MCPRIIARMAAGKMRKRIPRIRLATAKPLVLASGEGIGGPQPGAPVCATLV
jgi:hypothetical protein